MLWHVLPEAFPRQLSVASHIPIASVVGGTKVQAVADTEVDTEVVTLLNARTAPTMK